MYNRSTIDLDNIFIYFRMLKMVMTWYCYRSFEIRSIHWHTAHSESPFSPRLAIFGHVSQKFFHSVHLSAWTKNHKNISKSKSYRILLTFRWSTVRTIFNILTIQTPRHHVRQIITFWFFKNFGHFARLLNALIDIFFVPFAESGIRICKLYLKECD